MTEEILKMKTKLIQIETDLNKKEFNNDKKQMWEKPKGTSLIQGLKQAIKELKNEKEYREQEIYRLKSNLKGSKINELEIELRAYIDECTRLRHHLEEVIKSKQESTTEVFDYEQNLDSLQKANSNMLKQINELKGENTKIKQAFEEEKKKKKHIVKKVDTNTRTEIYKLRTLVENNNKEHQKEIKKYNNELQALKAKLDAADTTIKQRYQLLMNFKPKAPKTFKIIWDLIPNKFKNIHEFIESLRETDNIDNVYKQIWSYSKAKTKDLKELNKYFLVDNTESIKEIIKEWFPLFDYRDNMNSSGEACIKPAVETNKQSFELKKVSSFFSSESSPNISKEKSTNLANSSGNSKCFEKSKSKNSLEPIAYEQSNRVSPEVIKVISLPINNIKIKTITKSDIQEILNNFCLILQIHRIEKSDFFKLFSGKKILNIEDISNLLQNDPFKFSKNDSDIFSRYLIEPFNEYYEENIEQSTLAHVCKKFERNSEDWEIFTKEDEEQLDIQLQDIISEYHENLKQLFTAKDKKKIGIISWGDFVNIVNHLNISFSPKLLHYCKLLFYSYNMKSDSVPYMNFIESYIANEQTFEHDMSEEDIATIVRSYLEKISENMVNIGIKVREAFECDENCLISFEDMKIGLEKLGIIDIPPDHLNLILDTLKFEDADFCCVSTDELAEILLNYGVGINNDELSVNKSEQDTRRNIENSSLEAEEQYSLTYEKFSDDFE